MDSVFFVGRLMRLLPLFHTSLCFVKTALQQMCTVVSINASRKIAKFGSFVTLLREKMQPGIDRMDRWKIEGNRIYEG